MLTHVDADVATFGKWSSRCLWLTAFGHVTLGCFAIFSYLDLRSGALELFSYLQYTFQYAEVL
jgi:hypothetical protein